MEIINSLFVYSNTQNSEGLNKYMKAFQCISNILEFTTSSIEDQKIYENLGSTDLYYNLRQSLNCEEVYKTFQVHNSLPKTGLFNGF